MKKKPEWIDGCMDDAIPLTIGQQTMQKTAKKTSNPPPQSHIEWNLESDGDYWKIRKEQLPAYIKYIQREAASHAYRRARKEVLKFSAKIPKETLSKILDSLTNQPKDV